MSAAVSSIIIGFVLLALSGAFAAGLSWLRRRNGQDLADAHSAYGLTVPALLVIAALGALVGIGGAVALVTR